MSMLLTEHHYIKKKKKTRELYSRIDGFCYCAKNLHNSTNYIIKQSRRISGKLAEGSDLEEWEKELVSGINDAVMKYNEGRPDKNPLGLISKENGFISDAYFLSWYMKTMDVYKAMPYATCAQICIQNVCRDWKSYYLGSGEYQKNPGKFLGMPHKPGYLDKTKGRSPLVLTKQNVSVMDNGMLRLPGFLHGIRLKVRHTQIHQVRFLTEAAGIRIQIMYEEEQRKKTAGTGVMAIDPGVNNLMVICMDQDVLPVIISGKPLKSINQYYNKQKAFLQSEAMIKNRKKMTARIQRLTGRRNRKVKDYMHKASRMVIRLALENGIGTIVIGKNVGWKQCVSLGKTTEQKKRKNQNFVSIPFATLIDMIHYKGELAGIKVIAINEADTSGTSYLDGEQPVHQNYDKSRRIQRGLFRSNDGILINADVNAAYQIMRKAGFDNPKEKTVESIRLLKVS